MQGKLQKGDTLSVARVTEISATNPNSFEEAVKEGVNRATSTLRNVEGAWVKEQMVRVEDGAVREYRVDLKVTFVLD